MSEDRSPGSKPGRVGAARKGSLVASTGVGFPQAHAHLIGVRGAWCDEWSGPVRDEIGLRCPELNKRESAGR